jgi:hypothetical protein
MLSSSKKQIPISANLIHDTEELAILLLDDYLTAREDPDVQFHILQRKKDLYFLARSMELKLQNWQFFGNENFELFDVIADAVKRTENAPEIIRLHFGIELDSVRKSLARKLLEFYTNKERSNLWNH